MHGYNNVEVSQCVLFDRERKLEIVFLQSKKNIFSPYLVKLIGGEIIQEGT